MQKGGDVNAEAVLVVLGFVLSLLGWAYQLGFFAARLGRSEKDINDIKNKDIADLHRKAEGILGESFKREVREGFDKIYKKIDDLPCHNPGWDKEKC
jgi:hypothetical protein